MGVRGRGRERGGHGGTRLLETAREEGVARDVVWRDASLDHLTKHGHGAAGLPRLCACVDQARVSDHVRLRVRPRLHLGEEREGALELAPATQKIRIAFTQHLSSAEALCRHDRWFWWSGGLAHALPQQLISAVYVTALGVIWRASI